MDEKEKVRKTKERQQIVQRERGEREKQREEEIEKIQQLGNYQ